MMGVEMFLAALMISLMRGTPSVTFMDATPAKWNVFSVICVPGSPAGEGEGQAGWGWEGHDLSAAEVCFLSTHASRALAPTPCKSAAPASKNTCAPHAWPPASQRLPHPIRPLTNGLRAKGTHGGSRVDALGLVPAGALLHKAAQLRSRHAHCRRRGR